MSGRHLVLKKFFRDRLSLAGSLIILTLMIVALFAPYVAPYPEDTHQIHIAERLQPPSLKHVFGTDHLGRDLLSRVIYGTRISLTISAIAIGACFFLGVPVGLVGGFYERWLGELLMRTSDVFLSLPRVILALALAAALSPSIHTVILALSITFWPWFSRTVYAETKSLKTSVFIEATGALGAGHSRILFLHVFPNVLSPIIIRSSLGMGYTILTAAMLGFLGVGAPPPTPEWGITIADSRAYLPDAWWYATFPGLAIFLTVMGFNMLGDGLRDILDPRIRRAAKEG
jgi:peptide/nickel transport system permease protein